MSAKIYSPDLTAELVNRVECRIEIESKSSVLSTNSRRLEPTDDGEQLSTTPMANPTLLIDDQLFKDTKTISTLISILALTLFVTILCCSSLMWYKCRDRAMAAATARLRQRRQRLRRRQQRTLSSSMSSSGGSSPSPSSNTAEAMSVTKIKENINSNNNNNNNNNKGGGIPSKSDFRRIFSIRLPYDFFDRSQTRTNFHENDKLGSKKFGVSFFFFFFFFF